MTTGKNMIDEKTVTKIAKLSRLKIADSEKAHYANEISTIIGWLEQLAEVNTDNVPMLTSVSENKLPQRADEITDGGYAPQIVKNAPKSEFDCFVVPKVVDQG
jgi:aspartyl-tRNA(Asn)/glutamyl-tRNA(Gln) amidotransferase subunit C